MRSANEEIKTELLSKWGEIPPQAWREYLSPDGQNLWDSVEMEYEWFHRELKAFFQGEASQIKDLEPKWQAYLRAKRKWFLAFYQMLRDAWEYLPQEFKLKGDKAITPGLLAAEILEIESKAKLIPAVAGYAEVSPRRNYDLNALIAKASHSRKPDEAITYLYKEYEQRLGEFYKSASLEVSIISHCRAASFEDKEVKKSLDEFHAASLELSAVISKHWKYPKAKRQVWSEGSIKPS